MWLQESISGGGGDDSVVVVGSRRGGQQTWCATDIENVCKSAYICKQVELVIMSACLRADRIVYNNLS